VNIGTEQAVLLLWALIKLHVFVYRKTMWCFACKDSLGKFQVLGHEIRYLQSEQYHKYFCYYYHYGNKNKNNNNNNNSRLYKTVSNAGLPSPLPYSGPNKFPRTWSNDRNVWKFFWHFACSVR